MKPPNKTQRHENRVAEDNAQSILDSHSRMEILAARIAANRAKTKELSFCAFQVREKRRYSLLLKRLRLIKILSGSWISWCKVKIQITAFKYVGSAGNFKVGLFISY